VRARLILLGLVPVALAACGGTAVKGATPPVAKTQQHAATAVTIEVTSVVTSTKAHQAKAKATTAGDRIEFRDVLLNFKPQFGKHVNERIGSDNGTMTFTSKTTARLDGVARLPDGQIRFSGDVTVLADNTITVPVVGGTGRYQHASGTLHVGAGSKRSRNTYKLLIESIPGPIA